MPAGNLQALQDLGGIPVPAKNIGESPPGPGGKTTTPAWIPVAILQA